MFAIVKIFLEFCDGLYVYSMSYVIKIYYNQ